ncbi:MgtC/SapB family protein [Clostridium sp. MCC353]|uniref:MgtC/SapB family protein n=1 Tax=Clostridium sp. MCC353 TaxID=2592646 RepID=UPI00207A5AA7|nr:MgtC/SapB family protein [Clostridium sp. MCC353]
MELWDYVVDTAHEWSLRGCTIRMMFALVIGTLIGIDRGMKRRGAGIKTHTLVCLGSAMVMMTSEYMFVNYDEGLDLSRMGAQVVSGVGFLGVGTIIVTGRNQVRGLTTAAGLWACACIGLAAGIGFIEGAMICLILVMFTLQVMTKVDYIAHKYAKVYDLYLEFESNRCMASFVSEVRNSGCKLAHFELSKNKIKGEGPTAIATIEVRDKKMRPELLNTIRQMEFVKYVEEL